MGMYAHLRRANPTDAQRLRDDPRLVEPFIFGDAPEMVEERMPGVTGFLLRLFGVKVQTVASEQPAKEPVWPPAQPGEELDLEKAWHGLHFLLTGTADGGGEPACFLMKGGKPLGDDDDVDARLLDPEQVQWFAEYLARLTPEELSGRFDAQRMTALRIYPDEIWTRPEDEDEPRGYLLSAFTELRDFMSAAAAAGDFVVVAIA